MINNNKKKVIKINKKRQGSELKSTTELKCTIKKEKKEGIYLTPK